MLASYQFTYPAVVGMIVMVLSQFAIVFMLMRENPDKRQRRLYLISIVVVATVTFLALAFWGFIGV